MLKSKLNGLAYSCPFYKENESCVVSEIREKGDFISMVKYINIMLYEKVLKIMECHISCAKKREGEKF
jgi:hypothetical protein